MTAKIKSAEQTRQLLAKAREAGADLVGIASGEALKNGPSHKIEGHPGWPTESLSFLVLGLFHDEEHPELDWWTGKSDAANPDSGGGGNTEGNRRIYRMLKELKAFSEDVLKIPARPLAYHVERGGIFLKDTAALAGLGTIGRNNLFISPEFGTRQRFLGMGLATDLAPTPPTSFDPCADCDAPCLIACPQNAFRSGHYERKHCQAQMDLDVAGREKKEDGPDEYLFTTKYCRACELACPAGR